MIRSLAIVVLLAVSGPTVVAAAEETWTDSLEWRAILESEAAVQTAGGGLQKWDFVFTPEVNADLGALGDLTAIGRLRLDPVDKLEPGRPEASNDVRSPASRRLLIGDPTDAELREFYLDSYIDDWFLRLGKQQIVWGEADVLRVLDLINPLHFREFILSDFEDRRIPLWIAQAEVPIGDVLAQFVWVPDHTFDDVPAADATFAVSSPRFVPTLTPVLVGAGPVVFADPNRPDSLFVDDDYGVRVTAFTSGWDLSFNYLFHYQDQAVLFRDALPGGGVRIRPVYERTHVVGGTFSNAFGAFTVRGEAAYSTERFFLTSDPADADGVFSTGELGYVLGLDYQYDSELFVSGQIFQSVLMDRASGVTRDRWDTTVSMLVQKKFRNDTITAGVLVLQSVNDGDGLIQVDIAYDWRSNIILKAGADIFHGSGDGVFGQFNAADRLTLGIEFGI